VIHAAPAAAPFRPEWLGRLYGIIEPEARRTASIVVLPPLAWVTWQVWLGV